MTELKVNPSPYSKEIAGAIRIEGPEFTHMATGTTHPHMARIIVEYVPRETTLDGDSVGEYFISFRDLKLEPDEAVTAICADLSKACEPMMMNVQSNYAPRNGTATNPSARYVHPDAQQNAGQQRIIAPR